MSNTVLATGLVLAGLAALLYGEFRGRRDVVWVAKPAASAGFLLLALAQGAPSHPVGLAILVALVFSFGGDVLLIPRDPRAFLGGLGSFLLGHVGFAAAFWVRGLDLPATGLAALAIVPVAVVVARWLLPHVPSPMKVPVLAYMTVISIMVAASVGTALRDGPSAFAWQWPAAAVMFFVSDLSVARDRFVAPGFDNRLWGLPLYYGAQIWFALLAAPGA
ncbi:lysoplasmalogenase [Myxococcota bacterium]|nr:lysoplasmalogenase [Myxococcota bacterium]